VTHLCPFNVVPY